MIQHDTAKKLLPILVEAVRSDRLLTYKTAARELGRDPQKNCRMVAQVCDLLDAAAAYGRVPLLALWVVREETGHVNRRAWTAMGFAPDLREAIIENSRRHRFGGDDFRSIAHALERLDGLGNHAAWDLVRHEISSDELDRVLSGSSTGANFQDAINDIGTDHPPVVDCIGKSYRRDDTVRRTVLRRAGGNCEFCGKLGFLCPDGSRYLECHHIIALADDGQDRVTNVIALCAGDHREAHFGANSVELEREMMKIVRAREHRTGVARNNGT